MSTLIVLTAATLARGEPGYAEQAEALRPLATTPAARAWLDEAARLPDFEPRSVYYRRTPEGTQAYSEDEYEQLPEDEREGLRTLEPAPAKRYYETMYGSPLAYLRAIDLGAKNLAQDGQPFSLEGARVFDLGFGQLGQLRMLAQAGAHAVGADPDPILRAMYSRPGDTGPVEREGGPDGSVTLVHDLWPADESARERVGADFDLIIARNLLKTGYLHPPQETPAYTQVHFGVPDADLLRALHDALRPGGVLVVYTLGGKYEPPGEDYSPSSDIANPWTREEWEDAGFEVIAQDAPEDDMARKVGAALKWDEMGMNLQHHLFGVYSIYRRPAQ
ncbi:MAG: hypothetical protein R3B57_00655 [Phycisphaerales bacterium]